MDISNLCRDLCEFRGNAAHSAAINQQLQEFIRPRAEALSPLTRQTVEDVANYLANVLAGGDIERNMLGVAAVAIALADVQSILPRVPLKAPGLDAAKVEDVAGVPRRFVDRPDLPPVGVLDPRCADKEARNTPSEAEVRAHEHEARNAAFRATRVPNETEALGIWKPPAAWIEPAGLEAVGKIRV